MTKAMPFLQKAILLSYDPRRLDRGFTRTVAALWRGAGRKVLVLLQGNGGGGNAGDNH